MFSKLLSKYQKLSLPIKAVFWFTIGSFIQKAISVITVPIFTRLMSTEEYGIVNIYNSWSSILIIICTLYLHMGVINNAFVKYSNKERIVSSFQGLITVYIGIVLVIVYFFRDVLIKLIGLPFHIILFMVISFIFTSSTEYWLILKRYTYQYKSAILFSILKLFTVSIVGVLLVIVSGGKGVFRIYAIIIIEIIFGLCVYIYNFKKGKIFFSKEIWLYAISFNIPLIPHYLSQVVLNQSDRIMIGNICGASFTAIYSIAYSVVSLVFIFTEAIQSTFVPWQYQHLKLKDYKSINKISIIVLIFVALLLLALMLFAPEAIMVMAGEKYQSSIYLIPVLSAGVFFNFLQQLFVRIELFFEEKKMTVVASIVCAWVNIIFNYIGIKLFGFHAAAYVTLICYICMCLFHYKMYRNIIKKYGIEKIYNARLIVLISMVMLITTLVILFVYKNFYLRITILLALFLFLFINKEQIKKYYILLKKHN
ncbi:oligosaccharide flippase family protein [[Clostridium] spiroforme]|nr:oligosaccharide flippase family protein [Thomasclavelia spiroformis]